MGISKEKMVEVEIFRETIKLKIKEFLNEMNIQDNKGTASPFYYVIRTKYEDKWEEKGMFLTQSDAKKHLESNHYHYSKDAHTFVKHAWRAPDMAIFFENLNQYFGIKDRVYITQYFGIKERVHGAK